MRNPPLLATLLMSLGVIILCALGAWQVYRLEWKAAIIEKLDAAYENERTAPLDLTALGEGDYAFGHVEGVFLPRKALLLGPRVQDSKIGNDLIVPLRTIQGTLLVNMGWTGFALEDMPIYHLDGQQVWFEGLARTPDWNSFTPDNEPNNDLWFKPNINEIATLKDLPDPVPVMLYAQFASHKFDAQFPHNERWYPNNNHLSYALFWFAMASVLIGVFGLRFLRKPKP